MFTRIGQGSTLWKGQHLQLPWGQLTHHGSSLALTTSRGQTSAELVEDRSPFLEVHWTPTYFIAGSAGGEELFFGIQEESGVQQIASLPRWDVQKSFTPGTHTVRFFDVDHESCVVSNEVGLAMVTVDRKLVWQIHHGDTTQRVLSVDEEHINLMGLNTAKRINTATGAIQEQPLEQQQQQQQ